MAYRDITSQITVTNSRLKRGKPTTCFSHKDRRARTSSLGNEKGDIYYVKNKSRN